VVSPYTHSLYFNFHLPTGSSGLGYKQIIAAQFTTDAAVRTQLALDAGANLDGTTSKFTCALYDITTPTAPVTISVTALASNSAEGSTFLCRIEDYVNSLSAGRNYGLRLNLVNTAFTSATSTIRQISLFTTSSTVTPSERIIYDCNPNFAESALYADFSTQATPPLAIATTTVAQTVAASAAVTLSFDVICNSVIRGSESTILLQWDSSVLTAGASLTLTSTDSSNTNPTALQKAYAGTFSATMVTGTTNTALLTGILDDLVVNRTFKLNLAGFTAAGTATSSTSSVSLTVLYKNSYSVVSFSKFNLVNVTGLTFTAFTAAPYDGWTSIRQGGAWNINFSFTPSAAYATSGYITLRQASASINSSKVNFLASTCDFSPMIPSVIASNNFGVRPICSPLRNDFNYKASDNTNAMAAAHDGSGIFFQLPKLIAGAHSFNVFLFAEFCGAADSNSSNPLYNIGQAAAINALYSFKIAFYKAIDASKLNEYRFTTANNLIPITTITASAASTVQCTSSYWSGFDNNKGGFGSERVFNKQTAQALTAFLYKEINDFVLPYITASTQASCTNCFFNDITLSANTALTFGSLLSTITTTSTNLLGGSPYLAVLGEVQMNTLVKDSTSYLGICNYIACAKLYLSSAIATPAAFKMEFSVANKQAFFTSGDSWASVANSYCYFSWGFGIHVPSNLSAATNPSNNNFAASKTAITQSQVSLLNAVLNANVGTTLPTSNLTTHQKNMIARHTSSSVSSNAYGLATSSFPTTTSITLVSNQFTDATNVSFPDFTTLATVTNVRVLGNAFHFAVMNTCIKWVTNTSPIALITSPYNYVDIQLNVQEASAAGGTYYTTKMNRFFKFVTDSYVLDHQKQTIATADNIVTWHVMNWYPVATYQSSYPNFADNRHICLIQIASEVAATTLTAGVNTLVVYLSNLTLLDMDPADLTSSYPINSTKATAYALNSLPFYIGQHISTTAANDMWNNIPWYKTDYVSYGPVPLSSGTDYTDLSKHTIEYGLPINYGSITANTVVNGFVLTTTNFVTRSISKLFLGAALWINVGSSTFSTSTGAFPGDIIFPTFCPNLSIEYALPSLVTDPKLVAVQTFFHYQPLIQLNFFTATGFAPTTYDIMYVPKSTTSSQGCSATATGFTNTCTASYWANSAKFKNIASGYTVATNTDYSVVTTVRYQAYNVASNTNYLLLCAKCGYGTVLAQSGGPSSSAGLCSGFLLLSSSLNLVDSTVTTPVVALNSNNLTTSGTGNSYFLWSSTTKSFYYGGSGFNKLQFNTVATPVAFNLGTAGLGTNYYTGYTRPAVDANIYANSAGTYYLYQSNNVGFYCTTSAASDNYYYTNNVPYNVANGIRTFAGDYDVGLNIVDWNSGISLTTGVTTYTVGIDAGTAYKNDAASSLKVTVKYPTGIALPGQGTSKLYLNMGALGANSVCGINYSTTQNAGMAEACTYDSSSTSFVCTLNGKTSETGTIVICCYGVSVNTDPITFPTAASGANYLLVNFASNWPTSLTTTSLASYTYNFNGLTVATANNWVTGNANNPDPTSSTSGATYKPSVTMSSTITQAGAYSKVTFTVGLGREAVRNSNIVISGGDLSGLLGTSMTPRCTASFQNSDATLDRFIDACTLTLTSTGSITVRIGNRVVKCGTALPKTIYVYVWPVQTLADTSATTYTVQMQFPASTTTNILQSGFTTALTNSPALPATPVALPTANRNLAKLCDVPTISPLVVGEFGDFTFNFDFSLIPTATANGKVPNEVFIFFPYPTFLVNANQNTRVACYFGSTAPVLTTCSTVEDNWLRVTIPSTATLAASQQVLVVGVPVPTTSGNIIFNCSANFIDSTNTRNVYATGTGTFTSTAGIVDPSTSNGFLRLRSVSSGTTEPRTTNSLTFVVSFDTAALAGQTVPTTIASNPYIVVTLPFPDYTLNWYAKNTVTATVSEWNLASGATAPTSTTIAVGTVTAYSNKIFIPLNDASRTITPATFQNWTIVLSGVPQPNDATAVSTGAFSVTISNSNVSAVYRGYNNLATVYSATALAANVDSVTGYNTNNLLSFARGLTYTYSTSKYIVDINGCTTAGPSGSPSNNYIYLRPGRANSCFFTIRTVASNNRLPQTPVTVSLSSTLFSMNGSATLNPSTGRVSFMVGTSCSTMTGLYLATFTISDTTNYYTIPPVVVFVDTVGTPSVVAPPTPIPDTAAGGYSPVTFTMADYNIDSITYTFYGDAKTTTATQDPSSAVVTAVTSGTANSAFVIPAFSNSFSGFFQITNATATGNQKFTANTTNTCFTNQFTVTFTVNSQQQAMSTVDISKAFTNYLNGASTTGNLARNSVQFTFTPPVAPMFINCMLICSTMTFVDSQVQTGTGFTPSPLARYFTQYLAATTATANVLFTGLVRGLSYQMRCFGSSTQVVTSSRTFTNGVTFTQWTGVTPAVPIQTVAPLTPSCASFSFNNTQVDNVTQQLMINYCQRFFTVNLNPTAANPNQACIVCTDSTAMMYSPGVNFTNSTLTRCVTNSTASRSARLRFLSQSNQYSRFLQNTSNTTNTSTANSTPAPVIYVFNVCPVQDLVCGSDTVGSAKAYADYVTDFAASLNNAAAFVSLLGRTGIPVTGTPAVVRDIGVPVLNFTSTAPVFRINSNDNTGWNLTFYNPTQVRCWWTLGSSTAPSAAQLQSGCNATISSCGITPVASTGAVISNTTTTPLNWNTNYVVWAYCSNNIPNSANFANVTQVYSFTTGSNPSTPSNNGTTPVTPSNNTNNNNTSGNTTNNTSTNKTSGSFIKFGIALLISLFFLF